MYAIELQNCTKKLKDQIVINDVSITWEAGQIYGISGRNGSGKTMLLRLIAGLIRPDSGTVLINGEPLTTQRPFPESMGIVIEQMNLWEYQSGFETLKTLSLIKNTATDDDIKRAMQRCDLDPKDKKQVRKYSLGMRQKLALAQALMEKPDLILLDEPTNSLDKESVASFYDTMREEKERGATIVITSHHPQDLEALADVQYEVDAGSLSLLAVDSGT